jgi:DNA-binding CsgD family transcriptional regulator
MISANGLGSLDRNADGFMMDRVAGEWSRPRAAAEALGLIGLAAAVLGPRGQPLAVNRLFKKLMPGVARERGERLTLADAAADALFAEALATLAPSAADAVRLIPIRGGSDRPPMIVHVVPLRGTAYEIFTGAAGILIVTPLKPQAVPDAAVLQGLFDLTPAEARVARGIGEGLTVEAIAEAFGLSRETIRSQLKAVLGKTGVGRQADLVAMLAGVHVSA